MAAVRQARAQEGEAPGAEADSAVDDAEDVQLTRALEVLKSWSYFERLTAANRTRGEPEIQTLAKP